MREGLLLEERCHGSLDFICKLWLASRAFPTFSQNGRESDDSEGLEAVNFGRCRQLGPIWEVNLFPGLSDSDRL